MWSGYITAYTFAASDTYGNMLATISFKLYGSQFYESFLLHNITYDLSREHPLA